MFSKINFTYKKSPQNSQSYLILREQLIKQKIRENEKKSLINCISLQNKVDSKKVQNTSNTFEQSREKFVNNDDNNTRFEIKLNAVSNLNTEMIDSVFEDTIILTDEQIHDIQENSKNSQTSLYTKAYPNKLQNTSDTFEQSREKIDYHDDNNTRFEIKLNAASNLNTGMIDSVFEDKIILTDKQIYDIQQNVKNSQTGLYTKADPNKLQNTKDIFEQSREKFVNDDNPRFVIKLNDAFNLNTGMIDSVFEDKFILTDEQNITNSQTSLYTKADPNKLNKLQNTNNTFEESGGKIDYHDANTRFEIKLSDVSNINTELIDSVQVVYSKEIFEQYRAKFDYYDSKTRFEIKLNDNSNINTEMIDSVFENKFTLIDQQIYENQQNIKNSQTGLCIKADPNKLLNTRDIIEQSREKLIINSIDNENEERIINSQTSLHIKPDPNKLPNTIEKIYDNYNNDNYNNDISIKLKDISSIKIEMLAFSFIEKTFENVYSEMADNTPLPFNVGRIHKRGIQIINHVYQSKYEYGKENSSGLGDFLRGCYFILEFCETYNFQFKIIFNNCISKFLLIETHDLERFDNVLKGISVCKNNNFREFVVKNNDIIKDQLKDNKNIMSDFVDYVAKLPQYSGNVFTYCIAFPINEIPEKNKEYMRKFLEPTNEMQLTINQTLDDLNITSKQYIVIHIRAGDSYLKEENDTFTNGYIYNLINNIKNVLNIDDNYLLIADSNDVKKIIQKYFPNFKTVMNPITHFGEGVVLDEEKVKNTMIDFYLLSHSKSIFSYSAYKHGSGFSYWCAKTFNIPYVCKYVQ